MFQHLSHLILAAACSFFSLGVLKNHWLWTPDFGVYVVCIDFVPCLQADPMHVQIAFNTLRIVLSIVKHV